MLADALRAHAPFDEMDAASFEFLATRLKLAYYPRGQVIVSPESGVVSRLHIIKQGRVLADAALGAGEFFPVGALIGRRATTHPYSAETDTFCWELGAEDFHALIARSPAFHAFCTNHMAMLLGRVHRKLHAQAGEAVIEGAGMLAPLKSALRRGPISCPPETPLGEVLRTMHEARVGSMVVTDAARVPVGIYTTVDVVRTAAAALPASTPIKAVMTADPVTIEEEATLADAALAMARHGIRHVVVTRDGALVGVVSERDLFALQRVGLRRTAERLHAARSVEELVAAATDIRGLARQLLAQAVGPEALTAMISALNDTLTRRVIELTAERHRLADAWCWLALGSEGRMEQTLVTDQDNALIYAAEMRGEQRELLAFADEVNRTLERAGFPLCKGDIMARNPRWCLSAAEWRATFDDWIRNNDPQALLGASIFFDFRPLAGAARLAGALREAVLAQTRANRSFCRAMAATAVQVRPPLGLIADFATSEIDLKALGARPFVDAARVLALAAGSPETGTAARLRAAGEAAAVSAFFYVQALRLREGANRIAVSTLNDIDRRVLKESFRQATLLQSRLALEFAL